MCIRAPASEKDELITQLSSHSHLQQTLRENFFQFHGIYIHVWSEKYVYWLSINRFSRFLGLQQVIASANVTCIKGVVRLKGRVWRFLSIALVKVVMDYSSVPVCQGGAPMYGRGQFLTVTVNPSSSLELSQELGYTVLL